MDTKDYGMTACTITKILGTNEKEPIDTL